MKNITFRTVWFFLAFKTILSFGESALTTGFTEKGNWALGARGEVSMSAVIGAKGQVNILAGGTWQEDISLNISQMPGCQVFPPGTIASLKYTAGIQKNFTANGLVGGDVLAAKIMVGPNGQWNKVRELNHTAQVNISGMSVSQANAAIKPVFDSLILQTTNELMVALSGGGTVATSVVIPTLGGGGSGGGMGGGGTGGGGTVSGGGSQKQTSSPTYTTDGPVTVVSLVSSSQAEVRKILETSRSMPAAGQMTGSTNCASPTTATAGGN